jgi:hypothetical protein
MWGYQYNTTDRKTTYVFFGNKNTGDVQSVTVDDNLGSVSPLAHNQ